MFHLLLDSSNQNLSVGLAEKGKLIDEISYDAWQTQSELMIAEIDKLLKKHHATRKDLEAVVVSKGPGSYTGVRIALTIAKTVSFALTIPLYLVSSLEALKDGDKPTICLITAGTK
jgi:tRNA threonylcarbamoyladenosine biosynthesis protein TsaB